MLDLFTDDLSSLTYSDVRLFLAIDEPIEVRPAEGLRLDYKSHFKELGDSVCSLANTFGGLLFVGVEEQNTRPCSLPGIPRAGELKTRIQTSIANTVYPSPHIHIGVVTIPETDTEIAVIRVYEGDRPPYMSVVDKKNRIFVRREGTNLPAAPLELERLIERRSEAPWWQDGSTSPVNADMRPTQLDEAANVRPADAYVSLCLTPRFSVELRLDRPTEQRFMQLLCDAYGEGVGVLRRDPLFFSTLVVTRDGRRRYHWRLSSMGWIEFSVAISDGGQVFLGDLAVALRKSLSIFQRVLSQYGWFGEFVLGSQLEVGDLVFRNQSSPDMPPVTLAGVDPTMSSSESRSSYARQPVGYDSLFQPAELLADFLHRHLRATRAADIDFDALVKGLDLLGRD